VSPEVVGRELVSDILTDDSDGQLATVPNLTQELSTRLQQVHPSTLSTVVIDDKKQ
jgi:hypothetical protein